MAEKRYVIEEIGNMFRVLKDNEPLTTKFENCDKQDVNNLIAELNELHEENEQSKMMIATLRNIVLENEDLEQKNKELKYKYDEQSNEKMGLEESIEELLKENKELQFQVNLLREQSNEFHRGARENANRVGQLEKENKELREHLKECTEKAKEEIRKQAENEAIRWANIGR